MQYQARNFMQSFLAYVRDRAAFGQGLPSDALLRAQSDVFQAETYLLHSIPAEIRRQVLGIV